MFRNLNSTSTQPLHLRRRQQARQDWPLPPPSHIEIPFSNFDDANGGLDLSIHHRSCPSGNRFSTLVAPPPNFHRDREYVVSGHRRRSRNSRGTKEAKKRRDARRNKRKFAAQMLDEQLSRDIDETLTRASIPRRPPKIPLLAPTPTPPFTPFFEIPSFDALPRSQPTPPRLPLLDFGKLDFGNIPYLATQSPPPPPLNVIPNLWCPNIPSRMHNGAWIGDLPKFFDLSHIPEPKWPSTPDTKSQELQLWRPNPAPKKQSRFFPAPAGLRPTVKLPPNACRLHHSEQSAQDPVPPLFPQHPTSVADVLERVLDLAALSEATSMSPNAANLWSILNNESEHTDDQRHQRIQSSWEDSEGGGVPIPVYDHANLPPELDGREIPYVHLNSLTGYANARGSEATSKTLMLQDSAICFQDAATQTSAPVTPVYELFALPLTPRQPVPHLLSSEIFPWVTQEVEANPVADCPELANSTAHYTSEQELFEAIQIALPASRPDSPCDLAAFLAMGHNEKCWCRDCDQLSEVVREEEALTNEDDEWMMWSTTDDESDLEVISSVTTPQPVPTAVAQNDDELEITRCKCAVISDWGDFLNDRLQLEPKSEEVEPDFLGYFDDGPAFARESEYDWVWNV